MEKNKKITLIIVIVLIVFLAIVVVSVNVFADPYENVINKDSVKGMIDEYDTDGDGKLSSLELSVSAYNAGMNTSIAYKADMIKSKMNQ